MFLDLSRVTVTIYINTSTWVDSRGAVVTVMMMMTVILSEKFAHFTRVTGRTPGTSVLSTIHFASGDISNTDFGLWPVNVWCVIFT